MIKHMIIAMGWLIGASFSFASGAEDLLAVYRLAQENDKQYREAIEGNRVAREQRPQALAALLPEVRLEISGSETDRDIREGGLYRSEGQAGFTGTDMMLSVAQPIFRRDRWIGLEEAEGRVKHADLALELAQQELMLRAAERYFLALWAEEGLAVARSENEATNRQLQQTQKRFEVGLIAMTDVQEAKARFDLAVVGEIEASAEFENARAALREITGQASLALVPLGEKIPVAPPKPGNPEQWIEIGFGRNLEIAMARQEEEVARTGIRRASAEHLPTLDLVGTHQRAANSADQYGKSDVRTSSLMLQLKLPIYQGGLVMSRTREARHLHAQAVEKLAGARRAVRRKLQETFQGVVIGVSRVNALRQALASTETALEAVRKGFQLGMRTSVDVLDAQRDLFRAKKDYTGARYMYILDTLRLEQAAGTLSEEDLVTVNGWLDKTAS
uniref:Outer membrane protein n=1 Tax=Candidatus Kentrum sp. FW TaxID=2126338 RepID=A0A450U1H1_9GAMM|nr:MAG: outer membrane protein [Candidatus Kentron sp. FW]